MHRSTLRIVRWDALVETPWKNGGGMAVDIAMSPGSGAGRPGDPCDWRINVATIARSGPFSDYPETDRDFRVLDGGPVELSVDGQPARLLHPCEGALRFPGDVPTVARLPGRPCRAFNVLTRRGRFRPVVSAIDIPGPLVVSTPGSTLVGFVVAGRIEVEGDMELAALGPFDAFVASHRVSITGSAGGRVILVDLIPVDQRKRRSGG